MNRRFLNLSVLVLTATILVRSESVGAQTRVQIDTPLVVGLYDDIAPKTVANFLRYVEDGDFTDSFIHRSAPGFAIQGGLFTFADGEVSQVPANPPILNEFQRSNTRGTIAMALLQDQPNSATSSWFINTENNTGLDDSLFTVFREVTESGMEVVDAIAQLPRWNAGQAFQEIPLIDYPGGDTRIDETHLVITQMSILVNSPPVPVYSLSTHALVLLGLGVVSFAYLILVRDGRRKSEAGHSATLALAVKMDCN